MREHQGNHRNRLQFHQRKLPERIGEANECCLAHDDCYQKQLGQQHCDHVFCECLDVKVAEGALEGDCLSTSEFYCFSVTWFGHDAYALSAPTPSNKTDEVVTEKPKEGPKEENPIVLNHCGFKNAVPIAFYEAISSQCHQSSDSFHSCCIDHNKCILSQHQQDDCHMNYCACVASSVGEGQSCVFASESFCLNAFSDRMPGETPRSDIHLTNHTHIYGYNLLEVAVFTFLWVVLSFGVGCALYCTLGRVEKTLRKVELISHHPPLMYSHLRDPERTV
ncbi:hypothetical protein L596_011370 [Steinernema carpocapsae]|uniref:Uncharacterized protein n=1 Tax=Steinernema carpocapsae TaxID=34508 RepID=A0A4U5NUL8_STECR|nr:hypothetical protein L596_011370 [Steinernema carpocapsae]